MSYPQDLHLTANRRIAYRKTHSSGAGASRPGVVFLGGFRSDMTGTKALHLEAWAERTGRAFLRFDYTGHGESSGAFEDGCISDWADDAYEAITRLTEGPQILVGSSMGGWLTLLFARRAPERMAGFVGVAAAPDFTPRMREEMDDAARAEMAATGRWSRPSAYSDDPYVITARLLDDGDANLVMTSPLALPCPVRLLQGTADEDVPVSVALGMVAHIEAPDLRLTLAQGVDHRFSGDRELALIEATVEEIA